MTLEIYSGTETSVAEEVRYLASQVPPFFPSCLLSKVWANLEKKVLFGFFFLCPKVLLQGHEI